MFFALQIYFCKFSLFLLLFKFSLNCLLNTALSRVAANALMYAITMFGQIIEISTDDGHNKKNGEVWNPNGIEMIYVEGSDNIINSFFIGKYEVTQAQRTILN